jgi:predicted kinase
MSEKIGFAEFQVILLIGLPGSGKSSFYRELLSPTHVLISKDLMKNRRHKEKYQQKLITETLAANRSLAIDNMNLSIEERAFAISAAHDFHLKVAGFYFPISVAESFQRNSGPDRVEVPPVAIYSAAQKLQVPVLLEGFDALFEVQWTSPRNFRIKVLAAAESQLTDLI